MQLHAEHSIPKFFCPETFKWKSKIKVTDPRVRMKIVREGGKGHGDDVGNDRT